MMFRIVFWDVDNYFTRQYIPEDNSEQKTKMRRRFFVGTDPVSL
jgi:hypothetical protein